jgi:predicted Zn finger-like uncharacterized protein
MNVSCPQCSTVYRVDPAKVPAGGVRARCSACGGVIPIGRAGEPAAITAQTPAYAGVASVARPSPAHAAQHVAPVRQSQPTPARPATLPPLRPTPLRPTPRTPWPSVPNAFPPAVTPAPTARPFVPSPTPVSVPAVTPPPPAPVRPRTPAHVPSTFTPAASATSVPAPGERRPINPFLARDPSLRAKRLARALVSDMVAYYPAKHSEGLQRGTLKELFRDEIKKSYDEYVMQVGSEIARTTPHFQEALNEVLGAGKRIF